MGDTAFQAVLDAYEIAQTEVTVLQYEVFRLATSVGTPYQNWVLKGIHPVVNINWYDAIRYCNWLSLKIGLHPVYLIQEDSVSWMESAKGFRLPTEAEWEYAAGGGLKERDPKGFREFTLSGSNTADSVGWQLENSPERKTSPVKQLKKNSLGLYDMSGNVWECSCGLVC